MAFIFDEPNKTIIVPAPQTETTVQEIVNECRDFEDELVNLDINPLISAAGKEVLSVTDQVGITCTFLGGWHIQFEARPGPDYIPCLIKGGNLVSADQSIPYEGSAFVTIGLAQSSSPTISNPGSSLTTEEHDAVIGTTFLERRVYIDTELLTTGTGTQDDPFNDFSNALDFAESMGIRRLIILSDAVIDRQLKNFIIDGVGTPILDCNGQNLDRSEFSRFVMRGSYTGRVVVQESVLDNNFRLYGFFEKCAINGDLTCVGDTLFANNFSNIAGLEKPSISVDGHKVSVRNYSGGILIKDCDSLNSEITIEMAQGKVYLENTCTLGIISVRGIATLDDQSNGTTVDTTGLVEPSVWKAIFDKINKYVKLIFFTK